MKNVKLTNKFKKLLSAGLVLATLGTSPVLANAEYAPEYIENVEGTGEAIRNVIGGSVPFTETTTYDFKFYDFTGTNEECITIENSDIDTACAELFNNYGGYASEFIGTSTKRTIKVNYSDSFNTYEDIFSSWSEISDIANNYQINSIDVTLKEIIQLGYDVVDRNYDMDDIYYNFANMNSFLKGYDSGNINGIEKVDSKSGSKITYTFQLGNNIYRNAGTLEETAKDLYDRYGYVICSEPTEYVDKHVIYITSDGEIHSQFFATDEDIESISYNAMKYVVNTDYYYCFDIVKSDTFTFDESLNSKVYPYPVVETKEETPVVETPKVEDEDTGLEHYEETTYLLKSGYEVEQCVDTLSAVFAAAVYGFSPDRFDDNLNYVYASVNEKRDVDEIDIDEMLKQFYIGNYIQPEDAYVQIISSPDAYDEIAECDKIAKFYGSKEVCIYTVYSTFAPMYSNSVNDKTIDVDAINASIKSIEQDGMTIIESSGYHVYGYDNNDPELCLSGTGYSYEEALSNMMDGECCEVVSSTAKDPIILYSTKDYHFYSGESYEDCVAMAKELGETTIYKNVTYPYDVIVTYSYGDDDNFTFTKTIGQ